MLRRLKLCLLVFAIANNPLGDALAAEHAQGSSSYDAQFLSNMSEHHKGAIDMMKMATEKARDAKIKTMAEKGIADQQGEIREMQALKEKLGGEKTADSDLKLPGMMPEAEMKKAMDQLDAADGTHFDKHFLETMIKHHEGAVEMSHDALKKASAPEVKQIAQNIHDKQKTEIEEMQHMLKAVK